MFEAVVLACAINYANACVKFTDMYGPYKTKQECDIRAVYMLADIRQMAPVPHRYKVMCVYGEAT